MYTIYIFFFCVCVCVCVCVCEREICTYLYILYFLYFILVEFFISCDEMGIYDVSAMITFITNMRSQPLHTCIGHSNGANCFYIMASERPEIARMVKMMINFGPAIFLKHMQSPIRFLLPYMRMMKVK